MYNVRKILLSSRQYIVNGVSICRAFYAYGILKFVLENIMMFLTGPVYYFIPNIVPFAHFRIDSKIIIFLFFIGVVSLYISMIYNIFFLSVYNFKGKLHGLNKLS